jgi:HEAT repeat protein
MSTSADNFRRTCEERTRQARVDPRTTASLISAALAADDDSCGDYVSLLHFRATREVLESAQGLGRSECSEERSLGAWILGQVGIPDRVFPDECLATLLEMLDVEHDVEVLQSICTALGFLDDPRTVERLVRLADHPVAEVRFHVAIALQGQTDELAVQALIHLSEDADGDVRDWATFALGTQLDEDTPEIREALVRRLVDSDHTARGEAMVGLARRKDERVIDALVRELAPERMRMLDDRPDLPIEAATELGDPRLLPALLHLREAGWENRHLEEAIECCRKDR